MKFTTSWYTFCLLFRYTCESGSAVNSFKPSETDGGGNWNKASAKPVPKGSKCNTVDFKMNHGYLCVLAMRF